MKTLAPTKRLSLSTLFLVSIMVAIVIAKETHQKGNSNPADVVDEYAVNKEVRQWRACYGGKCSRRRSGKRGMKMVRLESFQIMPKKTVFFLLRFMNRKLDCCSKNKIDEGALQSRVSLIPQMLSLNDPKLNTL